jgi:flagellar protein FliO/FliZ
MGAASADLPGYGASLAWSFLSLGFVCVVAFFLLRWLGRKGVGQSNGLVRVRARCHLEPKRSAYLLEAGGRCFLIGVGDGPVTLLAEIDKAAFPVDADKEGKPTVLSGPPGLGRLFRRGGR